MTQYEKAILPAGHLRWWTEGRKIVAASVWCDGHGRRDLPHEHRTGQHYSHRAFEFLHEWAQNNSITTVCVEFTNPIAHRAFRQAFGLPDEGLLPFGRGNHIIAKEVWQSKKRILHH